MAIDIGADATNRSSTAPAANTLIDTTNPANASGALTAIEIWTATNLTGCKVGTFYIAAGVFYNRDYETLGAVTGGSKQTFTGLNITVDTGDYLGVYFGAGTIEMGTVGDGYYYYAGDVFGTSGAVSSFTLEPGVGISVYGRSSGWPNIAKVNGVLIDSLAKVNGVLIAAVAKYSGTDTQ